jgi:hypothetical protein
MLIFASFIFTSANAWDLKKDNDGIRIYTQNVSNTNIKAIKAEITLNTSLSKLTALLLDVKAHELWVYSTKTSYLVKKLSDNDLVYYSEMKMPWPLTNRDVVVEIKITQHPVTKVVTVSAITVQNYVMPKTGIIRVPLSTVTWTVTPVAKNQIAIEYIAQADPGGSIPAWVTNMFCTKGPYETFKKLRETVASANYQNVRFDFISEAF